jgi:hypothetical protein
MTREAVAAVEAARAAPRLSSPTKDMVDASAIMSFLGDCRPDLAP